MHPLRGEIEGLFGHVQGSNVPDNSEIKLGHPLRGHEAGGSAEDSRYHVEECVLARGIELSLFTAFILSSSLISFSSLSTTTVVRSQYIYAISINELY